MANVATLSHEREGRSVLLREAKYRLPALWLACFEAGDVGMRHDEDGEPAVVLTTTPATALARLEARRPALEALVSNLHEFLPGWIAVLRGLDDGRLVMDATEVLEMTGRGDDLARPLQLALGALDVPNEAGLVALLELASLGEHRDPATGVVSTPAPRAVASVVPELAGTTTGDALFPFESPGEALTGSAAPGSAGSPPASGAWTAHQRTAAWLAALFAAWVAYLAWKGRPPSQFGWIALTWASSTGLALLLKPRVGTWLYAGGTAAWAGVLLWWLATGSGRATVTGLLAALAMVSGWFQLRAQGAPSA